MQSRTAKPFLTTNLIVFAPDSVSDDCGNHRFVAQGEALIVDPGCRSEFHEEVKEYQCIMLLIDDFLFRIKIHNSIR